MMLLLISQRNRPLAIGTYITFDIIVIELARVVHITSLVFPGRVKSKRRRRSSMRNSIRHR